MRILALESSTTSAKAMYYDTETGENQIHTEAYGRMHADGTLQDAEHIFRKMAAAGRQLAQDRPVDIISLCSAWHSVCLCDRENRPATPVYPWTNTGAAEVCENLRKDPSYVKWYYHMTGCMVHATYPFFKLLWLREQGWNLQDYQITGQGAYNTWRLTGKHAATLCMASGSGLLDIHSKSYAPELLKEAGITENSLPELVPYDRMYPLTEEGAVLLGIKAGTPVIPSSSDGGLNQVGAGALKEGIMTFSAGTSGALRLTVPEPVLPEEPGLWCYLSPKAWLSGAAVSGCCNCIDWFRGKIGRGASYEELEAGGKEIADTPVFLPFVFGERCPGWNDARTGGFQGLKAEHDLPALYRAVQEGVLFHLYSCYQILEKTCGSPEKIRLSGGILHSEVWTQMCADIFGREMETDGSEQGSLTGAAVLAMELAGLGKAEDLAPKSGRTIYPDAGRAGQYREKFHRYRKYYELENV